MCGIVGILGKNAVAGQVVDALKRLEYRGYDSAGVAIVDGDRLETRKCAGRIADLGKLMTAQPPAGRYGISHTRWATHGKPTDQNAHPHFDQSGKLALVHNGVIENYQALRDDLLREGEHTFTSDTDTEVLAHLIGKLFDASDANGNANPKSRLVTAVRSALQQVIGTYGISHTRWATHGKPTDQNAHPHFDQSGKLALVHNGVIENYQALREQLLRDGQHDFTSDTDTEVLAHLIGRLYDGSGSNGNTNAKSRLVTAVRSALQQVIGTYGIALVHQDIPDFIVGARRGSPLVLGVGKEENFLASDVSAIVAYTRDAVYLNDFDIVAVEREKFEITSLAGEGGHYQVSKVEFTDEDIKKGDYPH